MNKTLFSFTVFFPCSKYSICQYIFLVNLTNAQFPLNFSQWHRDRLFRSIFLFCWTSKLIFQLEKEKALETDPEPHVSGQTDFPCSVLGSAWCPTCSGSLSVSRSWCEASIRGPQRESPSNHSLASPTTLACFSQAVCFGLLFLLIQISVKSPWFHIFIWPCLCFFNPAWSFSTAVLGCPGSGELMGPESFLPEFRLL